MLVAGTPVNGKSLSKCGRFLVSSSTPDTFAMNYTAVTHRHDKPVALILNAKVEGDVVGNMQLRGSKRTLGENISSFFKKPSCALELPMSIR